MTDRPILFSGAMIRALLDGRKTMTRRLAWRECAPKPGEDWFHGNNGEPTVLHPSPWQKVKPGDRLWVREAWRGHRDHDDIPPRELFDGSRSVIVSYAADGEAFDWLGKGRRSLHMPRWASRLTLIVTATKIEPLLDISEEDARAEGFEDGQLNDGFGPRDIGGGYTIESPGTFCSAAGMFQVTWAKLHPEWDGFSSPEVVAISFTVHKTNIDQLAQVTA